MKKLSFGINDIVAGTLSGFVIIIIATAFTALVFHGPQLGQWFSVGIGCALMGSCIVNLFTSVLGSFPTGIARPEPAAGVILYIIFSNLANYPLTGTALLATIIATLILISFLTGTVMFFLGQFRLGNVVRFLPYPVMGGLITGIGWIMALSSFKLIHNNIFDYNLLQTQTLLQLVLATAFALFLLYILNNNKRLWILPLSVLVCSVAINILLYLYQVSHEEAIQSGWLFSSFKADFMLESINVTLIEQINWHAILFQAAWILGLTGMIVIILLLNISGLETTVMVNADLEHDLKIAGIGNITGSLFNGVPCNISLTGTLLNANVGAVSAVSGIVASTVCLVVFFLFPKMVSWLPIPIIAGLLIAIALKLMLEWLYEGWFKLSAIEYSIVLAILFTVAVWNFVTGLVFGVIIMCLVFVFRYAKISAIKFEVTGTEYPSKVIRSMRKQQWLIEHGNQIRFYKLHGYLFFGSIKLLLDRISNSIREESGRLKFLILDFELVNGLDSTANFSFIRLQQLIASSGIQLIFTHCSPELTKQLQRQQVLSPSGNLVFSDSDQGIEWCEDQILLSIPKKLKSGDNSMTDTLDQLFHNDEYKKIFARYLEKFEIEKNQYLCREGEKVDCIYFIDSGYVSVILGETAAFRLLKSGSGTIVGEIGFYYTAVRTASVRTDSHCVVYKLTLEKMSELEKAHPDIALIFHKKIIQTLANRLMKTNLLLKPSN